ncbi:MAG TPA: TIGR03936 family radical SAM-associated protein [Anaerolineales bacterium]|jgi:radical SAM-linked protein|nr:TIGR03936 family radical SAM-associated protein [Anaerolineales bacterium]
MQRLRITFAKRGAARFIGNLDLHRTWERTLRRANAPLAYSQGFHPTPKLQLASALPLGINSEAEVVDIWLREPVRLNDMLAAVAAAAPPGIEALDIAAVDLNEGSLQSRLRAAEYLVEPSGDCPTEMLIQCVKDILGRATITRKRRGKDYDLRELIDALAVEIGKNDTVTLRMRLAARPGATGRPEEVMDAMGISGKRVHRTALFFVDNLD